MRHLILSLSLLVVMTSLQAAPSAQLWERWQAHDPSSIEVVDHGQWQQFLASYLVEAEDGINRVRYGRVEKEDRQLLKSYLNNLSHQHVVSLNRNEQRAFWINLYNALTIEVILEHYPVSSIRDIDISPGWFSDGPWGKKLFKVEGVAMSLDDIEHRILRPVWKDPRIHYAVNCASLGCPNLQPEPYTSQNGELLLERSAHDYINHARGVRFDKGGLVVSSIYKWFKGDFGGGDEGVIKHLRRYAEPDLQSLLAWIEKIEDDEYDWSLNDLH